MSEEPKSRSYLMEDSREGSRLEAKTDREDVNRRLRFFEFRKGMRVLDAGAGTGAVARVLADLVGPTGDVTALDFSFERSAHGRHLALDRKVTNLRFLVSDLYAPALRPASFDFVWCEFVFEYLKDPDAVLRQLAQLVRSGGSLVVADLDGNGMFHYPLPPGIEVGLQKIQRGLEGSFDPFAGRKIYHRFRAAGLAPIRVEAIPYHLYPGAAAESTVRLWQEKLKILRPRGSPALGGPEAYDRFADSFLDLLRDPDALTYSILFLVEWKRP